MNTQCRTFHFEIPLKTISEANVRSHYMAKASRAKKQKRDAAYACRAACGIVMVTPGLSVDVTMVRLSRGVLDDDNLRSALKAVRDGIADYLGIDDGDARVKWNYEQGKPVDHPGVAVVITFTQKPDSGEELTSVLCGLLRRMAVNVNVSEIPKDFNDITLPPSAK